MDTDETMTSDVRRFAGEELLAASPERVFASLTDLDPDAALARSIPDLVSAERIDERTLRCVVKPGFSFMRATMKLTIIQGETDPSQRITSMSITSKGIGASMKIDCCMTVREHDGGSRIDWEAHVLEKSGLLAAVSPALIRGAADTVIRNGWAAMRRHVET